MNSQLSIQEKERPTPTITTTDLACGAGGCAILAGIMYIVIQWIHPADDIASVGSAMWLIVACMTAAMSLLHLIGITGIYMRQGKASGWLGLAGYVIFSLFWFTSLIFSFIEAFVLPLLTEAVPEFVAGMAGLFGGTGSTFDLGIFPVLAPLAGVMYMVGGVVLGFATLRAGVFSRPAAVLLAFGAAVTLAASVIPHPYDRFLAIPMGIAMICLGYESVRARQAPLPSAVS